MTTLTLSDVDFLMTNLSLNSSVLLIIISGLLNLMCG